MGYEVDFLAVGDGEKSGDAIALRFGNLHGHRGEQTVVVIDGGFKESGEALVEHIKHYYGTDYVDIVVSTHPDADHSAGLEVVLEQLGVGCLWMHLPWNHTQEIARMFSDGRVTDHSVRRVLRLSLENARSLEQLARRKKIPIFEPFTGLSDTSGSLVVLSPSETFYESLLPDFRGTPAARSESPFRMLEEALAGAREFVRSVREWWGYETLDDDGETSAENNSSVILLLEVDGRSLLFTGDAGIPALTRVADVLESAGWDPSTCGFVQVPHHGSRRNVGPTVLNRLVGPKLQQEQKLKTAFVSASKNGNPKHPSKKVTNAFLRRGATVHATQGSTKSHRSSDAPTRDDWCPSTPLPFYDKVEE